MDTSTGAPFNKNITSPSLKKNTKDTLLENEPAENWRCLYFGLSCSREVEQVRCVVNRTLIKLRFCRQKLICDLFKHCIFLIGWRDPTV